MQRGVFNIIPLLLIAGVFLGIMLVGVTLVATNPIVGLLFRFYMVVVIFMFIKAILGNSAATYLLTAALSYIFVIHFWYLLVSIYLMHMIVSFGLGGIIIFLMQSRYRM